MNVSPLVPQDLDAERQLIGSLLVRDEGPHDRVAEIIAAVETDELFFDPGHGAAFRAIRDLHGAGAPVNVLTVARQMAESPGKDGRSELEFLGGQARLHDMVRGAIVGGEGFWLDSLRTAHQRRRLIQRGAWLQQAASDPDADLTTIAAMVASWASEPGASAGPGVAAIEWPSFWAADHKAEDWLMGPLIPRGRSVAMFSAAKAGKSLLALDVCARLATGQRVLDRPAGSPVSVVYCDFEMTPSDLFERLVDLGFGPESDLSRLHYYSLPSLPPLDTHEGGGALRAIAARHDAALAVVDTMSRVVSGPENEADSIRAFYRYTALGLKADGRALWRLDHSGKDAERGMRGTSAKNDDVDLVWHLIATATGVRLRATHRRQNWVPEVVDLVRLEAPLRHELAASSWPAGTEAAASLLDELAVPLGAANSLARSAVRSAGHKVQNVAIAAALRYRRDALENQRNGARNAPPDATTERPAERCDPRFAERLRNGAERPFAAGAEQFPPLRGERSTAEPLDCGCHRCGAELAAYDRDGQPVCVTHREAVPA